MSEDRAVVTKPNSALSPELDLARHWFRNAALLVLGFVIVATVVIHMDVRGADKDKTPTHDTHIAMPTLGAHGRASAGSVN